MLQLISLWRILVTNDQSQEDIRMLQMISLWGILVTNDQSLEDICYK